MQWTFMREFIKRPREVGALTPSSRRLAEAMVAQIQIEKASTVVEVGPGFGAVTSAILEAKSPEAKFFAIEKSPVMARIFRERHPEIPLYEASLAALPVIMAEFGLSRVDCVISGIPWAWFGADLQDTLLQTVWQSLSPGGRFVTFAYIHGTLLPAGLRFRRQLEQLFQDVQRSETIWNNVPPAFVYRCRK